MRKSLGELVCTHSGGVLTFSHSSAPPVCYAYVQAFNSGAVEAVDTYLLSERNGKKLIPSTTLKRISFHRWIII
jgi:hypothetical protein